VAGDDLLQSKEGDYLVMKLTKTKLKQLIKEVLNEITATQADSMPLPSGTDQGIQIVRQHLQEIVVELTEGELVPHLPSTLAGTGHTGVMTDLDGLADKIYRMIMRDAFYSGA
tara:strand:+ start:200 stop:538 length:339 start_codon:yes stop_codon:yes gene_type:complete